MLFILISMVFKESGGIRSFPVLEKVFGFVVVERRKPITPEKRAGHLIATLAVEIAEAKVGLQSKEGKQEVVPVEGRRWKQGAGKSKSGGRGRIHNYFQFGRNQKNNT